MNTPRAYIIPDIVAPCLDCPERYAGCHSTCKKYQAYKEDVAATKKTIIDKLKGERAAENYTIKKLYINKQIRRAKKRK